MTLQSVETIRNAFSFISYSECFVHRYCSKRNLVCIIINVCAYGWLCLWVCTHVCVCECIVGIKRDKDLEETKALARCSWCQMWWVESVAHLRRSKRYVCRRALKGCKTTLATLWRWRSRWRHFYAAVLPLKPSTGYMIPLESLEDLVDKTVGDNSEAIMWDCPDNFDVVLCDSVFPLLMYSRCFSELTWTKRSDNRLLKHPRHCYMYAQAWSHTETVQVERKWTRGCFLMVFYCGHEGESTLAQIGPHPFLGFCSVGNGDELSHFSYSWVALDVISTPHLLPFSHPRVLWTQSPLVVWARGGRWKLARPGGTQQCVSRVRGLATLFLGRWNTSGSQGDEGGRGERTTLKLFGLFSLSGAD